MSWQHALLALVLSNLGRHMAAAQPRASARAAIEINTDEADQVLAIGRQLRAGRPVSGADWERLFATEGYRRLAARERSLGRAFGDSAFRAFVASNDVLGRLDSLEQTLTQWKSANLRLAEAQALAYLPGGAAIRARIYPVIKPQTNSFVFETRSDSAAIFLYVDPAESRDRFLNTVTHEFHHIGLGRACRDPTRFDSLETTARNWASAFGEGLAMLAAAGDPRTHPHTVSDTADRNRWDRDMANADADLRSLEGFFTDILDGRLAGDALTERAMSFFGVQGPWYTIGYRMARAVELAQGRIRLVDLVCDPVGLMREYNRVSKNDPTAPRWSEQFLSRFTS